MCWLASTDLVHAACLFLSNPSVSHAVLLLLHLLLIMLLQVGLGGAVGGASVPPGSIKLRVMSYNLLADELVGGEWSFGVPRACLVMPCVISRAGSPIQRCANWEDCIDHRLDASWDQLMGLLTVWVGAPVQRAGGGFESCSVGVSRCKQLVRHT